LTEAIPSLPVAVLPFSESAATMNDVFFWLARSDSKVSLMTVGSDKYVSHLQVLLNEAGENPVFHNTHDRDLVLAFAACLSVWGTTIHIQFYSLYKSPFHPIL
jgi:hypothetical protein